MKQFNLWFILALIAVLAMTCASQLQTNDHTYIVQADIQPEHDTIKLEDILQQIDRDGIIHFDTNKTKHLHGFTGDSIIHYYPYLFGLKNQHNELRVNMKYSNNWHYGKETKYLYDLYHKGYLLAPRIASTSLLEGQLYKSGSAVDRYYGIDVDTAIKVTPKDAFDIAIEESRNILKEVNLEKFIWEYEAFKRYTPISDEDFIRKTLTLKKYDENYRLSYSIEVMISTITMTAYKFYIDAQTGEILGKESLVNHLCTNYNNNCTDATAPQTTVNVNTRFYGNQDIYTYTCNSILPISFPTTYKLGQRDEKINFYYVNPPSTDVHICWDAPNNQNDIANAGYFALLKTINFFKNELNISFGDGLAPNIPDTVNNFQLNSVSSGGGNTGGSGIYTTQINNSPVIEAAISMGTDDTNGEIPNVKIKQIAHEYTHNVITSRGNYLTSLFGAEEYGIMEFFCDVFGLRIENEIIDTFAANEWKMQLPNVNEFRDFSNPLNSTPAQPNTYNGVNWSVDGHINCGVPAHWYYLIAEGKASAGIPAIGIDDAFEIAKKTLFYEIADMIEYPQKDFVALRRATLKVTRELFGDCSDQANAVRTAWDEVGVTGGCELYVDLKVIGCTKRNCKAKVGTCGATKSSTGLTKLTINWYKKKANGTYALLPALNQKGSVNLRCNKEYMVEVIDVNSPEECLVREYFTCKDESVGTINPCDRVPPAIMITGTTTATCDNKGDVNLTISGGLPPYNYNWSDGSTSQNLNNVVSGIYTVTVTDQCYTPKVESFTVSGFPALSALGNINYPFCNNLPFEDPLSTPTISIDLTVNGGQTPYTFNWSNGSTTQNLTNISTGSYTVTITDANSCSKTLSFTATISTPQIYATSITDACPLANDGTITTNVIGGTPPYNFTWVGPANSQNIQNPINIGDGTHYVTVRDAKNCKDHITVVVPTAPHTFVDNLSTCERVYTCRGSQYSVNMIDYNNPVNDYDQCQSFIPCQLPNGAGITTSGTQTNWYVHEPLIGAKECRCECWINGTVGLGETGFPPSEVSNGPCGNNGTWIDYFCNGVFAGGYCDEPSLIFANVENPNPPIEIFPNPFKNQISIKFKTQNEENITLRLYNIMGQEVWHQVIFADLGVNKKSIKILEDLSNGIYFLHFENAQGMIYRKKLIKQ